MNIPNYVQDRFVDENGVITPEWRNFMNQLITVLQNNLSNEGYLIPQLPASSIALLTNAAKSTGAIVYDSTHNEFKGNIAGTWKTFTLT